PPAQAREFSLPTMFPKHYLSRFHKTYNDQVEEIVARERQRNWVTLFRAKVDQWANPEVPRLHPWIVTTGIGQGARVIAERNPYYWKVDTAGNQLPYMDRVTIDVIADNQVKLLKALAGDFDFVDSYIGFVTTPENRGLFDENQAR